MLTVMRKCIFIMLFMVSTVSLARIISIPDDHTSIQAGVDSSSNGDTVLVHPGTYYENIFFYQKSIVIGSLFLTTGDNSYASSTIVDGENSDFVLRAESDNCLITGFTFQHGTYYNYGGVTIGGDDMIISDCIIRWNGHSSGGTNAGVCCMYGDCIIKNNYIYENDNYGIACVGADDDHQLVINNTISDNYLYGIHCGTGIDVTVTNNLIINHAPDNQRSYYEKGAIECYYGNVTAINNTIYGNNCGDDPLFHVQLGGSINLINNIIWNNSDVLTDIDAESELSISFCDIEGGWPVAGNIDIDPLLRDPDNGDYHLMSITCGDPFDSPCIDAGNPCYNDGNLDCLRGLGFARSDMGAYGGVISANCYEYLTGDINMSAGAWPPSSTGLDVTYLVNYFRGIRSGCFKDGFFAAADVNGDCQVVGSDVTSFVNYLRGQDVLKFCRDYPPIWLSSDMCPVEPSENWPDCESIINRH